MNQSHITVDVYQDKKGGYRAVLPEMRMTAAPGPTGAGSQAAQKVTLAEIPPEVHSGWEWAPWGINDCQPTQIRNKFDMVGIAGRVQWDIAKRLFGNGLEYCRRSDMIDNPNAEPCKVDCVEEWLEESGIETEWLFPQFLDYRYNWNSFSEIILNRRGDQVTGLYHKEAEFSRLAKQNPSTYMIDKIYYSPYFAQGHPPPLSKRKEIPLMPWFAKDRFLKKLKGGKFAWHTRIKTPGTIYYARPYWLGLIRKNGWMDVSANVPEIVNAMQENQMVLKYQIQIPESYFKIRHAEKWDSYTDEERNAIIDRLIDNIEANLAGTKNVFKSITTLFRQDPITQKDMGKVEIIAIDDKLKKDSWVPSSEKADAQIVQSLGGHPSMLGLAPEGGSMGAGSGSDKRELFNIEVDTNNIEQRKILEPLNWIARFNRIANPEWDVVFRISHNKHTTKNKKESGVIPPNEQKEA